MIIEKYLKRALSSHIPEDRQQWNYPSGCVLLGALDMYQATQDLDYLALLHTFAADYVDGHGVIRGYDPKAHSLDLICSARVLIALYDKTKEARFRDGAEAVYHDLLEQPRTQSGSFWHKSRYPNQLWLDGLYMAQPFYVAFEARYRNSQNLKDTMRQFENVHRFLYLEDKGLYCHAYDESRKMYWADPVTGRSPTVWLRSIGWFVLALVDCLEEIPLPFLDERQALGQLLVEALRGLLRYMDCDRYMFYQVVDMPTYPGNYLETSGSAMIAYAILKGCRLGLLPKEEWQEIGVRITEGVVANSLVMDGGELKLVNICASAGLGTFDGRVRNGSPLYYVTEPQIPDNAHGVAMLLMAYSEYLQAA